MSDAEQVNYCFDFAVDCDVTSFTLVTPYYQITGLFVDNQFVDGKNSMDYITINYLDSSLEKKSTIKDDALLAAIYSK